MEILKFIHFFMGLDEAKIERLAQISSKKAFKKGEILFYEGDTSSHLIILLKGTIEIYKTAPSGKEIYIHEIRPMSFVAEAVNFENIPYPASARFASGGEVLKIDYEKFVEEFLSEPEICISIIKSISAKLRALEFAFENSVVLPSEAKISKFIIENFDIFTSSKHIKIAKILNITPETFSRTITKFKKSGALLVDKDGEISGFDREKLEKFI
ncbi:Crp/Fnr family transcriptional regulator [Campylobacter sp. JMF_04 NA10]|uniref:Crp/Fnr family transcriptional regulator n=1 Tax=Campylobacter sp. JMF_04 NA10 TaxID=2983824 RepID=UPI0022E9F968|nr:Crp/Fnr family transcriptional regulator [Campylobacter sp. JMF_04 NA10]MDA3075854.1 Crp/Fnr family transcriptional regulator [Campylobacter sp. JMF_04 NA10]